jgi:hypothetical protein
VAKHRHIQIEKPGQPRQYQHVGQGGGGTYQVPPRDDRVRHGTQLQEQIEDVRDHLRDQGANSGHAINDVALEVVGGTRDLQLASLERLRRGIGIELRSVVERDGKFFANVFVPSARLEQFVRLFEQYAFQDDRRSGMPKNHALVAGIDEIRTPVLRSFWTDDDDLFPADELTPIWWEVWIQIRPTDEPDAAFTDFVGAVGESQLRVGAHVLRFPERLVFHVHGTVRDWTTCFFPLLDRLAELRKAKEVASEFFRLDSKTQHDLVDDLLGRLTLPSQSSPAICVLDHGITNEHPLIKPFLQGADQHKLDPSWTVVDTSEHHGIELAGLALFGTELPQLLISGERPLTPHGLESVRILNKAAPHPQEAWGWVTQEGVALAEQQAPNRSRVILMTITADDRGRDNGYPTSWSAAIDQSAAGQMDDTRRLYVLSSGNIRTVESDPEYDYPADNLSRHRIEDPGQAWNALTVGACTDLIQIRDPAYDGYSPLAPPGGLCPASRTSASWTGQAWPLKPDIVLEGGNYAKSPDGTIVAIDDFTVLTTGGAFRQKPLTWMADTSAAAAQAARMAGILQAEYPTLWPETIRAIMVHSAEWTPAMLQQVPGESSQVRHQRLRCFGYGKPDLERARFTANNRVALVHQGELQPFEGVHEDGTRNPRTKDFHLHSLPWPASALEELHEQKVRLRVTLSYFIEPSPGRRGWNRKFRYQSHGLRFKLRGPYEKEEEFLRRVSAAEDWDEEQHGRPSTADPIPWALSTNLQGKGSIHSDWWATTGAELASCGQIAIHPVTGWWRERPHLGCVDKKSRYALVITLESEQAQADLYTPILNQIATPIIVES